MVPFVIVSFFATNETETIKLDVNCMGVAWKSKEYPESTDIRGLFTPSVEKTDKSVESAVVSPDPSLTATVQDIGEW